jgi:hypothetical protein
VGDGAAMRVRWELHVFPALPFFPDDADLAFTTQPRHSTDSATGSFRSCTTRFTTSRLHKRVRLESKTCCVE